MPPVKMSLARERRCEMIEITLEQIKQDLETAAYVERMLQPVKPPKYRCWLFEIVYTPQEIAFMDRKPIKLRPTKEQIDLWERVLLWVEILEPNERQLVWKRAKRIPWKLLSFEYGLHRSNLYHHYECALMKILVEISKNKP